MGDRESRFQVPAGDQLFYETEWEAFLQFFPDFYVRVDRRGRFLAASRVREGVVLEDVLESGVLDYVVEEEQEETQARLERVWDRQIPESYVSRARLGDGVHHYRCQVWPVVREGRTMYLGLLALEITELVETRRKVDEMRSQFETFLDHSPAVSYLKDLEGKNLIAARPLCELLGRSREEILGRHDEELYPPETVAQFRRNDLAVTEGRLPLQMEEDLQVHGAWRTYLSHKFPVLDGEGEVVALGGVSIDITERKHFEEALRRSEEDLAATLRSIGEAVIATGEDGRVSRWNPAAEVLLGLDPEQLEGAPLREVYRALDPRTGEPSPVEVDAATCKGEGSRTARPVLLRRDGQDLRVFETCTPVRDRRGVTVGLVLVLRDVTDEARLEQRMRQAQKMQALGQLAGGVAHDFNNLLFAILGNADLLVDGLEATEDRDNLELARAVKTASQRAAGLTRQLLAFARADLVEPRAVALDELIREVTHLLEHTMERRVTLRTRFSDGPAWIRGDTSQLQTALVNLAVNARDAMPDGGTITFGVERSGDGRGWVVVVEDTGVGIPEGIRERIFEPFFTTKGVGKGTGLGLAAVYGIVQSHGGDIQVECPPEGGTRFRIRLPEASEDDGRGATEEDAPPAARSARVLLVEDEPTVQRVGRAYLERQGHECRVAGTGEEALRILDREGPFDLVVLDLVMPGLSGQETLKRIRERSADLPVLVATGFNPEGDDAEALAGAQGVLRKPFTARTFGRALLEILGPEE